MHVRVDDNYNILIIILLMILKLSTDIILFILLIGKSIIWILFI